MMAKPGDVIPEYMGWSNIVTDVDDEGNPTGGLLVPEPYAKELSEAWHEGRAIKGPDIMAKIRASLAAWQKLLKELRT